MLLAAVMYVDDTDLLHWAETYAMTSEELIEMIQNATMDWGNLDQASEGLLKDNKCSIYLLCYKYIRGRAKLKSL